MKTWFHPHLSPTQRSLLAVFFRLFVNIPSTNYFKTQEKKTGYAQLHRKTTVHLTTRGVSAVCYWRHDKSWHDDMMRCSLSSETHYYHSTIVTIYTPWYVFLFLFLFLFSPAMHPTIVDMCISSSAVASALSYTRTHTHTRHCLHILVLEKN